MRNISFGTTFLLAFTLLLPLTSSAYTSTKQTAIQLSEQRSVYMIEFAFGTRFNDFYIPIRAVKDVPYNSERDVLGYSVIADRTRIAQEVETRSMVISNLEVVDNTFYRIPAGQSGVLTLVTEVVVPTDIPDSEYLVQVNSLPHYVGEDRDRRTVNSVELRNFISPGIDMNIPLQIKDGIFVKAF